MGAVRGASAAELSIHVHPAQSHDALSRNGTAARRLDPTSTPVPSISERSPLSCRSSRETPTASSQIDGCLPFADALHPYECVRSGPLGSATDPAAHSCNATAYRWPGRYRCRPTSPHADGYRGWEVHSSRGRSGAAVRGAFAQPTKRHGSPVVT